MSTATDTVNVSRQRPRVAVALSPRFGEFVALGPRGFTHMGYTAWGAERAERTVVCMHGLTRNGRDFDVFAQRLAGDGMRVVAPDLPGRGRSASVEHGEDYGTPLYLAVSGALIAHLGATDIDWVGTSLGGHIGMEIAARQGSPIRRLILNDFGAHVPAVALQRIGSYHRRVRTFSTMDEVEAHLRAIYAPFGALTDAQWRHLAEHSVAAESGQLRLNYDPKIVTQFSRPMFLDVSLWRIWEQVTCPVLILHGENSDLLLPETVKEMKRRGIAAKSGLVSSLEIPDCGHAPALMAEDQIRSIEDFLLADIVGAEAHRGATEAVRAQ